MIKQLHFIVVQKISLLYENRQTHQREVFELFFITIFLNIKLIEVFNHFSFFFFSSSFEHHITSLSYYLKNDKNESINNRSS